MKGVYGAPPAALAEIDADAVQLSPLSPGSAALEALAGGALSELAIQTPPGALERRYTLAQGLRVLQPGGRLTALGRKDLGGGRIAAELSAFGCPVEESAKAHHRVCISRRPAETAGLETAIAQGALQQLDGTGLWTQPGVFSWDRPDPGSALLIERLPALTGEGADLGCGVGRLALAALASPKVERLHLVDRDRRAIDAARRNVGDPRAELHWADAALDGGLPGDFPGGLDFVVMNPPFHHEGAQTHALGQAFIARAAKALRKGGVLWMVANRRLPYEAALGSAFARVEVRADQGGYKVIEARR